MTDVKLEDADRVAEALDDEFEGISLSSQQEIRRAVALLRKIPVLQNTWRCYYCGEVCRSEVDARNHFGSLPGSEPACQIKQPGEFALLQALRNAEDQLARYRAEDSDTQRAMYSMQSDHQQALRREEETGYARGVADMRKEVEELRQQLSDREWQDVSSAPEMRAILLYIVTDRDDDGKVRNWEMATGVLLSPDCRLYENETRWEWKGRRLKVWEYQPSHWMPLPGAPQS